MYLELRIVPYYGENIASFHNRRLVNGGIAFRRNYESILVSTNP